MVSSDPMKIKIDRFGIPPSRCPTIEAVTSLYNLPIKDFILIFDKFDDGQLMDTSKWKLHGNFLNSKTSDIPNDTPDHIMDLIITNRSARIVWLSESTCASKDEHFIWVFSHELRHVEQDMNLVDLKETSKYLDARLKNQMEATKRFRWTQPEEFDADLSAFHTLKKLSASNSDRHILELENAAPSEGKYLYTLLKEFSNG